MSTQSSKRQETSNTDTYHLIYWPGIPGRGEFIRLALEQAGASYTDTGLEEDGFKTVLEQISAENKGDSSNTPPLTPPILKHGNITISQTPNILLYLGSKLDLAPDTQADPTSIYFVNQLVLTALDGLSNEPHDTHHPIAVAKYYEDQKEEAFKKAQNYRETRLPKFLGYFQRVLEGDASRGGDYLYGGRLTYADLVLFQCVDGLTFAFPKCLENMRNSGKYDKVFTLCETVKNKKNIKTYLASGRRQKYSMGIYRHYPELDDQ